MADNAIPDVKTTDKFAPEIYEFYRAGILTGSDVKGAFHADSTIKRSEAAAILLRMFEEAARKSIALKYTKGGRCSHLPPLSMVNPLKYYDNNLGGTRTMLQSMIEHGVKYIVFSSTAATYGEPERVPILETDPTHPTNCYGDTKLAMERMFYWASVAHGIHFVALRYFNACGAHMSGKIGEAHNPETHLIPIVLQVPNGQRDHVSIFGDDYPTRDGTCVRDYIHVTDLASAHILAAEYLMNGGENNVFNLGNGVGFTVKEIIDTAEKVVGKPIKCEMAARRAGDPAQLVASSEKAKTVLGWKPKYDDIETIIGSAWNWHKEHPHGYED